MEAAKQWIVIHIWQFIAGLWVCLCFALIFLELGPRIVTLTSSITEWKVNEAKITEMDNWTARSAQLTKNVQGLEQQLKALYISIPRTDQMSVILDCLHESSEGIAISLTQVKTQAPVLFNTHQEQPMHIEARGKFHAIGAFIDRIEKSPFLIKVEALRISRDGKLLDELRTELSLHAIVVAR